MDQLFSDNIEPPKRKNYSSVVVGKSNPVEESKFTIPQNLEIDEDSDYDSEDAKAQDEEKQLNNPPAISDSSYSDSGSESMHSQLSAILAV